MTTLPPPPRRCCSHVCMYSPYCHSTLPPSQAVCEKLRDHGHIERWQGRFGSLDAESGVFTPKQNSGATRTTKSTGQEEGDFFGLLCDDTDQRSDGIFYVGVPTMKGLCEVSEKEGGLGRGVRLRDGRGRLDEVPLNPQDNTLCITRHRYTLRCRTSYVVASENQTVYTTTDGIILLKNTAV